MNLLVLENVEEVGRSAARLVRNVLEKQSRLTAALPTGRTPLPFYAALREVLPRAKLPGRLRVFMLDEYRGLPASDPRSFRSYLEREAVEPLGLGARSFFALDGDAPDPRAECLRYERAIAQAGGLDLAILGLGENGHVAFNEPGAPAQEGVHLVRLSNRTRQANAGDFGSAPDVPKEALTLGLRNLREARALLMLVSGTRKTAALRALIKENTGMAPAAALMRHPRLTILADRDAVGGPSIRFTTSRPGPMPASC
jgi:glucosamine-6-phosphate deaminase